MKPDAAKVTISDNENQIIKLLDDLVLQPRLQLIEWSRITKQTPNIKIGYPGQHLSSLVTGVEGSRTGARGHDLRDFSEVKSCSRIDQLDKCKACGASVARLETECPECSSKDIHRKNDSKWLFSIRTEAELKLLTKDIDRVLLMIGDHPNFDEGDFSTLRFQAFEIWPRDPRATHFVTLMDNYYRKIYLGHKEKNPSKNPAPKNFWPYSYQFYMCNPVRTFCATVVNSDTAPEVSIDFFLDPVADRSTLDSEVMPAKILGLAELDLIARLPNETLQKLLRDHVDSESFRQAGTVVRKGMLRPLDEKARKLIPLRDTDVPVSHANSYSRI